MSRTLASGWTAAAILLGLIAVALFGILTHPLAFSPGNGAVPNAYLLRVVLFTIWQAVLSTLISVVLGSLVGLAFHRASPFPGDRLLLRLFALPLAIPALVGVLGILGIFGDAGFLSRALTACGLPRLGSIYGLTGILIAHVFFNLPLVARLVFEALERTPAESWRLADALSMWWKSPCPKF